ncbi:MAG: 4-alpha-glucanotransferase [Sedimentisphaerales bacterium]
MKERASGILLHITSLPSKYGIGDFGPEAYRFADFLKKANQTYWQILPLNYTTPRTAHSPYSCLSGFAGNPLLISPELLCRRGLLTKSDIKNVPGLPQASVDYTRVAAYKKRLLQIAFRRFKDAGEPPDFKLFCTQNSFWLDDFASFVVLRQHFGRRLWNDWPTAVRDRNKKALKSIKSQFQQDIDRQLFLQYIFYQQWSDLKHYCRQNGIQIIGDIPIYVTFDSADVWSHPEIFKLSRAKKPRYIAGVPPDYFSRAGQLWGNPVYNWQRLKNSDYCWWMHRIKHNLDLFDLVRIDHFRGFVAYWQVPAAHKSARDGRWAKGPKEDFFNALLRYINPVHIIAEDLGRVTADVRELIHKFGFPCMRVLQFGFDGDANKNPHILHNHIENCVVYTGTHDNNTARGWFSKEAEPEQKKRLFDYLGRKVSAKEIHLILIRLAFSSVARIAIIPMQDILGLGEKARMNRPGTIKGNWRWRLQPGQLTATVARRLKDLTQIYGRD